ncbi:BRCA1-A complex subunit RAP80 isoform X3 [Callorhinchus milii]|uniref:BRCA1-A complex subunit RAP80 isoform X3 n=1 Tax=Callorhinchus milii TaxID=7868 RepID=UPI001C3F8F97|nr:BRCA1-A complex subunit RAP80 isoform X3 [Callorhinchus milii]
MPRKGKLKARAAAPSPGMEGGGQTKVRRTEVPALEELISLRKDSRAGGREKSVSKCNISQMTEEEQLALAFLMSEREADERNLQREEEEHLMKKAIAESLHFQAPSNETGDKGSVPIALCNVDVDTELGTTGGKEASGDCAGIAERKEIPGACNEQDALPNGQLISERVTMACSPLVVLEKLSETIAKCSQESSIVLSQDQNFAIGTRTSPLKPISPFKHRTPLQSVLLDKVLPSSSLSWMQAPESSQAQSQHILTTHCEPEGENPKPEEEMTCNLDAHPASDSSTKRATFTKTEEGQGFDERPVVMLSASATKHSSPQNGLVRYFWGVPFCPKGVDPDQYTEVILCQLQTYRCCLKVAQRQLLRKMRFGEPVLPAPMARKAHRSWRNEQLDNETGSGESEEENAKSAEGLSEQPPGTHAGEDPGEEQVLHESSPQLLIQEMTDKEENKQCDGATCVDSKVADSGPSGSYQSEEDEQLCVCADIQENLNIDIQLEFVRQIPESNTQAAEVVLVEDDAGGQNLEPSVTCPLCGDMFPVERIEVHAADCNGCSDAFGTLTRPPVRSRRKGRSILLQNGTAEYNYTSSEPST